MALKNAQPRFGYDDTDDTIFDYLTSRSIKVGEPFESVDGVWNSIALRDLIKTHQSIEGARVRDKVQQADADFDAELARQRQADAETVEREKRQAEERSRQQELARKQAEADAVQNAGTAEPNPDAVETSSTAAEEAPKTGE